MTTRIDTCLGLALSLLLSGCSSTPPQYDLSSGAYVFVADITDIPDNETTHDESKCTVAREGTNATIKVKGMTDVGRWWVGSVRDNKVFFTLHEENPNAMVKAMQFRMILEGEIRAEDCATGVVKGYYEGTNNYITGTWTLRREKEPKASNPQMQATGVPPTPDL